MKTIPGRCERKGERDTGTHGMNGEGRQTERLSRCERDAEEEGGIHGAGFMVEANKAGGGNTARTYKFSCSYVRG